jgi:hypothetical protein
MVTRDDDAELLKDPELLKAAKAMAAAVAMIDQWIPEILETVRVIQALFDRWPEADPERKALSGTLMHLAKQIEERTPMDTWAPTSWELLAYDQERYKRLKALYDEMYDEDDEQE